MGGKQWLGRTVDGRVAAEEDVEDDADGPHVDGLSCVLL